MDTNTNDFVIPEDNLNELNEQLNQRLQYYQEENARMEAVFRQLYLLNEDQCNTEINDNLETLAKRAEEHGTIGIHPTSHSLSQADKLRIHNMYSSKIKICTKLYVALNEKLTKEIQFIKTELEESKNKISAIPIMSNGALIQSEEKIKRYEKELLKAEIKYPWLKKTYLHLPNISEELNILRELRTEKESLEAELEEKYHGLAPDMEEAAKQVEESKRRYIELQQKLLSQGKIDFVDTKLTTCE